MLIFCLALVSFRRHGYVECYYCPNSSYVFLVYCILLFRFICQIRWEASERNLICFVISLDALLLQNRSKLLPSMREDVTTPISTAKLATKTSHGPQNQCISHVENWPRREHENKFLLPQLRIKLGVDENFRERPRKRRSRVPKSLPRVPTNQQRRNSNKACSLARK